MSAVFAVVAVSAVLAFGTLPSFDSFTCLPVMVLFLSFLPATDWFFRVFPLIFDAAYAPPAIARNTATVDITLA